MFTPAPHLREFLLRTLLPCSLLLLAVSLLYGGFLSNPLVFDDIYFFDGKTPQAYAHSSFHLDLRWFAHASLGWTAELFGQYLLSFRLGNLALHAATVIALFLFLRALFAATQESSLDLLTRTWQAFAGALLFGLHPAAVYAAGYLIERSIVMATLFSLLALHAYLMGLQGGRRFWFLASSAFYFLAVFSKEHAVMMPAVALALTFLLYPFSRLPLERMVLPFVLFVLTGALAVMKAKGVLGAPYEPFAQEMMKRMSEYGLAINVPHPYLSSVATQCFLFFKYLLLWLFPNPAWMSVDMRETFAVNPVAWPYWLGIAGFVLYGVMGIWLLLQRGRKGLLGFAMLFPWLLFATELSSVRIQEPFVLYRSYMWMAGIFSALPLLLGSVLSRRMAVYVLGAAMLLALFAWNRLVTFSHPLLLWDDAAALIADRPYEPGFERIYFNRGHAFNKLNMNQQALDDCSRVIAYRPDYSYAYNDRGEVYYKLGQYRQALDDLNKSIELKPDLPNPYFGRGLVLEALREPLAARADFMKSCELGMRAGCGRLGNVEVSASNAPQPAP